MVAGLVGTNHRNITFSCPSSGKVNNQPPQFRMFYWVYLTEVSCIPSSNFGKHTSDHQAVDVMSPIHMAATCHEKWIETLWNTFELTTPTSSKYLKVISHDQSFTRNIFNIIQWFRAIRKVGHPWIQTSFHMFQQSGWVPTRFGRADCLRLSTHLPAMIIWLLGVCTLRI